MLALGEKLVAELRLIDSTDTLARWMAHYVAELMERERTAPSDEKEAAQADCARAILELWSHCQAFPKQSRAFQSLDSVLEVLAALSPESDSPYYRDHLWRALEKEAESSEISQLLTAALGIDYAARTVIEGLLTRAVEIAAKESEEWIELARGLDDLDPITELRLAVVDSGKAVRMTGQTAPRRLRDRIARLDAFMLLASSLREELQATIAGMDGRTASGPGGTGVDA